MQNKCMLCDCVEFEYIHRLRDKDDQYAYRCKNCGHVQIIPLPTVDEDFQYYQSSEAYSGMFKNSSDVKDIEKTANRARRFAEYQHKKLISLYMQIGKLSK